MNKPHTISIVCVIMIIAVIGLLYSPALAQRPRGRADAQGDSQLEKPPVPQNDQEKAITYYVRALRRAPNDNNIMRQLRLIESRNKGKFKKVMKAIGRNGREDLALTLKAATISGIKKPLCHSFLVI